MKIQKKIPCTFFLTLWILSSLFCQDKQSFEHPFLTSPVNEYKKNNEKDVYFVVHQLFNLSDRLSYLSGVIDYDRKLKDIVPLRDGEGDNFFLESNIYIPFTILRGRDGSSNLFRASKVTFNYWGQIRISNEDSSPILPPTNSYGVSYYYSPSDNFRGGILFGEKKYENGRDDRLSLIHI